MDARKRESQDELSGKDASPEPMSVLQRVLSKSRMRAFQDSGDDDDDFDHANPPYTPPHRDLDPPKKISRSPSPGLVLKKDSEPVKPFSIPSLNKAKRKRKVKRGSRTPSAKGDGQSDDNNSDSSSVASVSSSTTEPLSTPVKLRKKKRRPRCEIHSKRRSRTDLSEQKLDGLDENLNERATQASGDKGCTCGRSSRSSAARGKRPEPEGGCSLPLLSPHFIAEYERIIYTNEPLFSDMEDDPVVDAQIRQESERHHKKAVERCGSDNLFSTAQMVNTNTTIKFAIIQTELKNVIDGALRRIRIDIERVLHKHLKGHSYDELSYPAKD